MSIEFDVRETFSDPPERVYRAMTDLDAAAGWMPNCVGIERLTPGELRVGSEWRETRKMFGKEATEQFEVTELDPPRRFGLRVDGSKGASGRGEYVFTYDLAPSGEGTEVRLRGEIRGLTGLSKLLGRMFAGPYRKACAKDLAALKAHLEERRT